MNGGRVVSRRPIAQITDGTSNTIQIGEIPSNTFCLSDVRATPSEITDGTSNTILIGETSDFDVCVGSGAGRVCVEDVRVPGSGAGNGSAIPSRPPPRCCWRDLACRRACGGRDDGETMASRLVGVGPRTSGLTGAATMVPFRSLRCACR